MTKGTVWYLVFWHAKIYYLVYIKFVAFFEQMSHFSLENL